MSDSNKPYRMARRINDPPTLFFWPIHWVMPIFMAVGASLVLGHTMLFLSLGVAWFVIIRVVETKYPRGYLAHLVWWKLGTCPGFINDDTPSVPNPMRKEFTQR